MHILRLFSCLFTLTITNCFASVQPALCHENESFALLQFKQSFVISEFASESSLRYPKTESWKQSTDCCSWDGVECDEQTGHVIGLHLSSSMLYGSIWSNSTIFHLLNLQSLNVSDNHFNYSQIPSTLAKLSTLTHLDLSSSKFSGEIPHEISQLTNLLVLRLCNNYILSDPPVSLLQLKQQNLRSIIQNFTSLEVLSLSYVNISSPIPKTLTNLSSLKYLSLCSSGVYGEFPIGIFNLPNLEYLHVGSNHGLTGVLPASIGDINALQVLAVENCNFSGSIPSSLGNLTQLKHLDLSQNKFHGAIPNSIFSLENLNVLYLCRNFLAGQLELKMFWNLRSLTDLCLSDIDLSLPTKTSSFNASLPRTIRSLFLKYCNMIEFPKLLKDHDQLEILDLSHNKIHESLPSWIWQKEFLWALHISNNFLVGEIPPSICNLKSLEFLDLSFNYLSGIMPPCLGCFSEHLHTLNLANNKLFGLIPQAFMERNSLQMVDFSQNNLQGQLPKPLVNCRVLEYLDVSNNQINDSFPFWLGNLPVLKVLALRSNKFFGTLSSARAFKFGKLHIIDLSQNDFSGTLPLELFQNLESMRASNMNKLKYDLCFHYYKETGKYHAFDNSYSFKIFNKGNLMVYKKLQEFYFFVAIDLSSNKLSGEIPYPIGDLKGLVLLNLSNNLFTGDIPSSLGKLFELEALDISHNSLSGKIPQELTKLTFLEFFDVSYNCLSGPIPQNSQFNTFESNSFERNQGLCGLPLSKKCEGGDDKDNSSLSPPSSDDEEDEDAKCPFEFDWMIIVIGYVGGLVFGLSMGSTFIMEKHVLHLLKRAQMRFQKGY